MRFPTDVPVKLVMLGTGGTGGHAAPHLYRLLHALNRPGIWEIKEGPYLYKLKREMVLLLGCVDNNKSRRLCHEAFCQSQDLVYIDSGNEEFSGQVVCGVRRNGRTIFKPVGGIAPEILKAQDRFPSEISCAEAATVMVDMVYNILAHGRSSVRVTEFSTQTAKMQTTLESAKRVAA